MAFLGKPMMILDSSTEAEILDVIFKDCCSVLLFERESYMTASPDINKDAIVAIYFAGNKLIIGHSCF